MVARQCTFDLQGLWLFAGALVVGLDEHKNTRCVYGNKRKRKAAEMGLASGSAVETFVFPRLLFLPCLFGVFLFCFGSTFSARGDCCALFRPCACLLSGFVVARSCVCALCFLLSHWAWLVLVAVSCSCVCGLYSVRFIALSFFPGSR